MRESKNNIVVRLVYGLLFALTVMGAIWVGPYGFALLMLAIIVGGSIELYNMTKLCGYKPQYFLGLCCSVILFALNFDNLFMDGVNMEIIKTLFVFMLSLMFVVELFSSSRTPIINLGSTLLSLFYVTLPAALMCNVALLLGGGEFSSLFMIAYFFIVWANDSFAYIVGITIGSHLMFARISPKKSWEGFFGGVVGSFIFGVVLALLLGQNYYVWGGMAILASISGVAGDLVESMFKREAKIKDSGDIIPGHGGWLDRFDAIFVSTPFVYIYLYILSVADLI